MSRMSARYILDVEYFPIRKLLEIQFVNDENVYQYYEVPEEVWYAMRNTLSVDLYFNMQISSQYKCRTIQRGKGKKAEIRNI